MEGGHSQKKKKKRRFGRGLFLLCKKHIIVNLLLYVLTGIPIFSVVHFSSISSERNNYQIIELLGT